MTEQAKTTRLSALPGTGMTQGYGSLLAMNGAIMEAYAEASQAYMQRMAQLNEEILGFAAERMQQNSKTSESFMKCKDWNDAFRVQQDWLRGASEQYMAEMAKLLEMSTKATLAGINPLIERTSASLTELRQAS